LGGVSKENGGGKGKGKWGEDFITVSLSFGMIAVLCFCWIISGRWKGCEWKFGECVMEGVFDVMIGWSTDSLFG